MRVQTLIFQGVSSLVCIVSLSWLSSGLSFAKEPMNESIDSKPKMVLAMADTFVFNPRKLSWVAINQDGKVVKSGRASGGSNYCPDIHRGCHTPTGTYTIWSKGGAGCRSTRYPVGRGGAKMPYCMFFSKYYAIHGSYEVPNYNASHGCIRIEPSDAKWLSEHFIRIGTKVVVKPY